MKKITILALHLGFGGIERAITDLANGLVPEYDVTIISTYKIYEKPVNKLDKRVKIEYLMEDKPNGKEFKENLKKLKLIKTVKEGIKSLKILNLKKKLMINYIKECNSDIIISTRDIHNKWLGENARPNAIKIAWEHNHHHGNQKYINKIIKSVENMDYFVLVSKELTEFYKDKVKPKCIYIPNTVSANPNKSTLENKSLISVGRLSPEKGYMDLIEVFNMLHKNFPDWKLNIVGDGLEVLKIKDRIKKLNLEENIILHGFKTKEETNKLLANSSIYVMTSYTESFGIVILEAFSSGLPCVAFSSAEGINELISNNWDGYIIKNRNKEDMVKRLTSLMENYNRRFIMGNNAIKKIDKFKLEDMIGKWNKILK